MKTPKSLGRYEVVDVIGHGGMGSLYRARDPRIGRYVAIKLLKSEFDTAEVRDRFSREARAAGGLSHPNIVTIYDVGEHDGLPFIAMEYVRGETFADLVCLRPPLPVARKLQLTEEVCAGLAHAHEAGIIHRDIRPANLIVGPEGTVKILGFGIAKLSTTEITLTGRIKTTSGYMSPEQVSGTPVDVKADVFSVGAVLYELLSHQPPFPGRLPEDVTARILNSEPTPIVEYCPDIDPRLARLVERALEKKPGKRFPDIASLQRELASIRQRPRAASSSSHEGIDDTRSDDSPTVIRSPEQDIEAHLAEAQRAYDSGNYEAALESCKHVLLLDASEERAIAEIDRIHGAIDARQLQEHLTEARRQLSRGATRAALESLESAAAVSPADQGVAEVRAQVEAAEAQDRATAARAAVDEARKRFDEGDREAAIQALEALLPASPDLVAGPLEELRTTFREVEEQRRIERERLKRLERDLQQALGSFDQKLEEGDLSEASRFLSVAAALSSTDSRVDPARQRLEQAEAALAARKAAEEREREGERKIEEAAERLEQGDLASAADLLALAAALVPQHPRAIQLSRELREALERRAAAERLRQEVAELIRSATERLHAPGSDAAQLASALREVGEAMTLDPENAAAATLKSSIEEAMAAERQAARVHVAITNARRRFANGKHLAALKVLEEFQQPSHPEIVAALDELRGALREIEEQRRLERERVERQQRSAELLAQARSAVADQRLDSALELLGRAREVDPEAPEIASLTELVREKQAAARLGAELDQKPAEPTRESVRIEAAIRNARSRFAIGKHQAAFQLLESLDATAHPEVADTLKELRDAFDKIQQGGRAEGSHSPAPEKDQPGWGAKFRKRFSK